MKILKTLVAAGILLAAAASMAQQGGGGRMMRMGMGMSDAFLLRNEDVQKDLKITPEQKIKLDKINEEFQAKMPGRGGPGGGGGQRMDPEAMQAMMKEVQDKINEVLDDTQEARLKQLGIQAAGPRALFREDIQKQLDLKAAQKKELSDLEAKLQEATMALFESMRNQEITREEMQASMQKNNETLGVEAEKVLTPEQKLKFESLKGPKFAGKFQTMGFGRRGGGPGGPPPGGGAPPAAGAGGGARPPLS